MSVNKGVLFLIDRMQEHPKEFEIHYANSRAYIGGGRWQWPFTTFSASFSEADWAAWHEAVSRLNEDRFLGELMSELADGPERRAKAEAEQRAIQQAAIAHKQAMAQQNTLNQHLYAHKQAIAQQPNTYTGILGGSAQNPPAHSMTVQQLKDFYRNLRKTKNDRI